MSRDMTGDQSGEEIWDIYYPTIVYNVNSYMHSVCGHCVRDGTSDSIQTLAASLTHTRQRDAPRFGRPHGQEGETTPSTFRQNKNACSSILPSGPGKALSPRPWPSFSYRRRWALSCGATRWGINRKAHCLEGECTSLQEKLDAMIDGYHRKLRNPTFPDS